MQSAQRKDVGYAGGGKHLTCRLIKPGPVARERCREKPACSIRYRHDSDMCLHITPQPAYPVEQTGLGNSILYTVGYNESLGRNPGIAQPAVIVDLVRQIHAARQRAQHRGESHPESLIDIRHQRWNHTFRHEWSARCPRYRIDLNHHEASTVVLPQLLDHSGTRHLPAVNSHCRHVGPVHLGHCATGRYSEQHHGNIGTTQGYTRHTTHHRDRYPQRSGYRPGDYDTCHERHCKRQQGI